MGHPKVVKKKLILKRWRLLYRDCHLATQTFSIRRRLFSFLTVNLEGERGVDLAVRVPRPARVHALVLGAIQVGDRQSRRLFRPLQRRSQKQVGVLKNERDALKITALIKKRRMGENFPPSFFPSSLIRGLVRTYVLYIEKAAVINCSLEIVVINYDCSRATYKRNVVNTAQSHSSVCFRL